MAELSNPSQPAPASEPPRFLPREPFERSRYHAHRHECDLAIPCYLGIGSLVCYTSLVEAHARRDGRPLKLLHGPGTPSYGRNPQEPLYPLWEHNPYVGEIINADEIDSRIMRETSAEMDNFCQFGHVIENICAAYGLQPRRLAGSLFLSMEEKQWALRTLAHLKRPLVCLCPYGRSSSIEDSPWHLANWSRLIDELNGEVGFFQTERESCLKLLPIFNQPSTVRQSLALIWASDLFIGFDTGPAHIATALEVPSVVLWDALRKTPLEDAKQLGFGVSHMNRWAYPQNRNLVILHERHDEVLHACIDSVRQRVRRTSFRHENLGMP